MITKTYLVKAALYKKEYTEQFYFYEVPEQTKQINSGETNHSAFESLRVRITDRKYDGTSFGNDNVLLLLFLVFYLNSSIVTIFCYISFWCTI